MDTTGSGTVDDRTVAEAAAGVRSVLTAIGAGQLTCSAAHRNRLQGAVVALESLTRSDQASSAAPIKIK